jgi:uncharacterized protein
VTRRYLLSIDGGGTRGIIPALVLAKLESTTGQLTRDIFSFVGGTSTGGIIAAAIAAGIPAPRIVELYVNRAREVFTGPPLLTTLRRIVFGSMYSTKKLHDLIAEEVGPGRAWSLNDSPIDLLITAKGSRRQALVLRERQSGQLPLYRRSWTGRLRHRLIRGAYLLSALERR